LVLSSSSGGWVQGDRRRRSVGGGGSCTTQYLSTIRKASDTANTTTPLHLLIAAPSTTPSAISLIHSNLMFFPFLSNAFVWGGSQALIDGWA